jgi:hypothetical protein
MPVPSSRRARCWRGSIRPTRRCRRHRPSRNSNWPTPTCSASAACAPEELRQPGGAGFPGDQLQGSEGAGRAGPQPVVLYGPQGRPAGGDRPDFGGSRTGGGGRADGDAAGATRHPGSRHRHSRRAHARRARPRHRRGDALGGRRRRAMRARCAKCRRSPIRSRGPTRRGCRSIVRMRASCSA